MECILAWLQKTALSIAGSYVERGVKVAIDQFHYICCLKEFLEELNQQEHSLDVVQKKMYRIVEEEGENNRVPDELVDDWMKTTDKAISKAHLLKKEIEEDRRCLNNWCPDWFWRYNKCKEAEELKGTLKDLINKQDGFAKLTYERKTPIIEFNLPEGILLTKASETALRDIMKAFETDGESMIGLYGMPGAGKTTLAIQAKKEAERHNLLDEFVKVTVTEKPNVAAIQHRIAEQLHLKFGTDSSPEQRASALMLRLQDKKRKLVILDDVWGELKLKEIGIPFVGDLKNCKILLTTRQKFVCVSMNCQRKILLDILTEDEAWTLFKTTTNLEDDSSTLVDVAKQIAKECGRLPVAVVSVAKALKEKSPDDYRRALKKLKKGNHLDIRDLDVDENAYKSLKFSFDELRREQTKRCLLLCSLFPEDYEICGEYLARYALGLRLYEGARSLNDVKDEVLDELDELKNSHLLLEGESEGYVKMHDLVRDVVLLIGKSYRVYEESQMKKEFILGSRVGCEEWPMDETFSNCAAISLLDNEIEQLESQLNYPRLEMLLLARKSVYTWDYELKFTNISDKSFDRMKKLQVLSLTRAILSVQSLECLIKLRTLELRHCKLTVNDFASLRNLKKLEILSFYGSDISVLPDEIGELKNLKLLDLTDCSIGIISPHVIEKLSQLEELSINLFELRDYGKEDNLILELNSLKHLAILTLAIRGSKFPKNFVFSGNWTEYHIHIGDFPLPRFPTVRSICICPSEDSVYACKELFKNVYNLCLGRNGSSYKTIMPDMSCNGFQHLSHLHVEDCDLECLTSTAKQPLSKNAFSNLVELNIYKSTVREICDGPPPEGFLEKLQTATVVSCDKMITIFPPRLLGGVKKLERVTVEGGKQLQEVFQLDGLNESNKECLSCLKWLKLSFTGALLCIWKGPTQHVSLKSLTHLSLWFCNNLKFVISSSLAQSLVCLENLEIRNCNQLEHIIAEDVEVGEETFSEGQHQEACLLQNLKTVTILECNKLEYVFPFSIARALFRLEELRISNAAQLKEVFGNRDEYSSSKETEIELKGSSTVGYLFFRNSSVLLPSLLHVGIHNCPQLLTKSILKGSTSSETLRVEDAGRIPLETLKLTEFSLLERIIAKEDDCNGKSDEISFVTYLQPPHFTSLQKIRIANCNKLKILLPITIARNLPHLEELDIRTCNRLVAVFGKEDQADINNMEDDVVLPKLLELTLIELPSLISFCPKGYNFILPYLELLRVSACPEMTTSFTATANAYVHIKPDEALRQDMAAKCITQILIAPRSADHDYHWFRQHGKWNSLERGEYEDAYLSHYRNYTSDDDSDEGELNKKNGKEEEKREKENYNLMQDS